MRGQQSCGGRRTPHLFPSSPLLNKSLNLWGKGRSNNNTILRAWVKTLCSWGRKIEKEKSLILCKGGHEYTLAQNYSQGSEWGIEKAILPRLYLGLRFNHNNRECFIPRSFITTKNVQTGNKNSAERGSKNVKERSKNVQREPLWGKIEREDQTDTALQTNSQPKHKAALRNVRPVEHWG